ncbi:hypothetical protein, partial [Roseospirillum parvum]|uniref:hypothetical protein n=1 Tax=Roseospirillum parvum TaxID=83401 RepID=UPI003CCC12A2
VTVAGNIRFAAERTPDGHADHFWALALAIEAASNGTGPIEVTTAGDLRAGLEVYDTDPLGPAGGGFEGFM